MRNPVTLTELTGMKQNVVKQSDGPGLRIDKVSELNLIFKMKPNGAKLFKENIGQFQTQEPYWAHKVGTIHDFRMLLVNNESDLMLTVVYDGSFKAYMYDLCREMGGFLDTIGNAVLVGYPGTSDPEAFSKFIADNAVETALFYVAHPNLTVKEITKIAAVSKSLTDLLNAAS